eukprot:614709-Alexandrium_andersonii.AAC.1
MEACHIRDSVTKPNLARRIGPQPESVTCSEMGRLPHSGFGYKAQSRMSHQTSDIPNVPGGPCGAL